MNRLSPIIAEPDKICVKFLFLTKILTRLRYDRPQKQERVIKMSHRKKAAAQVTLLLAGAAACGTGRRVNVYAALTRGAEDGLTVLLHVIPALVGLLTAVSMFRASGAMDALAQLCAPVLNLLGIPAETVPLMLVRPVSGSGALAVASDLMASHGPDSYIGRVAAVMLGSTETTFYTIAVYFGSAGIVRTRHTVPAALAADLTGFLTAALTVRLLFGP